MAASPNPLMETVLVDGQEVRQQRTNAQGQLAWRLRVRDPRTGKQPETTFYGTEPEAWEELLTKTADVRASARVVKTQHRATTFEQWALEWLENVYVWKYPPSKKGSFAGVRKPRATWAKAFSIVNANLMPTLGPMRMRSIGPDDLVDLIGDLCRTDRKTGEQTDIPLKGESKSTVASVCRALFRDAVTAGVIKVSPAAHLPTVWADDNDRLAIIPSLIEVEKLAAAMDTEWSLADYEKHLYGPNGEGNGDLVRAIAYLGPRWSEFVGTSAGALNLRTRVMRVADVTASESGGRREVRKAGQAGKSAAAKRDLIVLDQVVPILNRLEQRRLAGIAAEPARAERRQVRARQQVARGKNVRPVNVPPTEQWTRLVNSERGGYPSYGLWRRHLDKARKASGVDYTAHELRHVCASLLVAAAGLIAQDERYGKLDITEVVRRHMGHQDGKTTNRVYRHLFSLDHSDLAARLSIGVAVITADEFSAAELVNAAEERPFAT
jgi:hypothetical protein